jgi:uncharacterized protein (TIGR02145 family)
MNFQAVIRDSTNKLVRNQVVSLKISVLQGSENGSVVYSEVHSGKTNENGIITLIIGNGTVDSGVYDNIDLSNGPYFFKREIDPKGGTRYLISGMSQLLSVPYGIYANTADTVLKAPDTSSTNEIQAFTVSKTGDTLYLSSSNYVIIPGISLNNNPTIKDIDGNVYNTVQIGNQVWMKQNLKTSRYNDGSNIPNEIDLLSWNGLSTAARCNYNNDENYNFLYGKLYNWYAVETGKLCPTGWHVPKDDEWTELTDYLGGLSVAGGKLKEVGNDLWNWPNEGATNEVGFTALPGGYRVNGYFSASRRDSYWWSATPRYSGSSWSRRLRYTNANVTRASSNWRNGFSVRCLRD